jgi:cellulose synthase/poly-beta-1,6-N-acetylglucosamine synthase-like glycosyltransferase
MNQNNSSLRKIAVLIFAQNESSVISKTVKNIKTTLRSSDALYVIADHCIDGTARLAGEAGAEVVIRNSGIPQGKGCAIAWFIKAYQTQMLGFNLIIILDADSLVPADFIENIDAALPPSTEAAQCYLSPIDYETSPITTLIALSDILEQTLFENIKSSLGLSVRLRGTGMVFAPNLLLKISPGIETEVEDIALSLLIADQRITIRLITAVSVFDPKPTERTAASRQRARWFRGQWKALWHYRTIIMKLIFRGPSNWILLGSLFLKPRWLKITLLILMGFVLIKIPLLSVLIFSLAGIELLLFLIGTLNLPNRKLFFKSLIYIPGFMLMWIKGIMLSLQHHRWPRVRGKNGTEE